MKAWGIHAPDRGSLRYSFTGHRLSTWLALGQMKGQRGGPAAAQWRFFRYVRSASGSLLSLSSSKI